MSTVSLFAHETVSLKLTGHELWLVGLSLASLLDNPEDVDPRHLPLLDDLHNRAVALSRQYLVEERQ